MLSPVFRSFDVSFDASAATSSAILAVVVVIVSQVITWLFSRNKPLEEKRFWRLTFRHVATLFFMLGLVMIWRAELQSGLLALGAAAAGILIAFREYWQSLTAFWIRIVKRQYGVNDFIEIDGIRGRVLDITWLTTAVAETGGKDGHAYTGRVVHIPNSKTMLCSVMVENFTGEFSAHTTIIPLPQGSIALKADALLLDVAKRHCSAYYEEACKHMATLRDEQALDTPSVEPRTRIQFESEGTIVLVLRTVLPFREKSRIEQSIIREFLFRADEQAWPITTLPPKARGEHVGVMGVTVRTN